MPMYDVFGNVQNVPICGLYYNAPQLGRLQRHYLPQLDAKVHASILSTTSRTVLQQTFVNPSATRGIREVCYAFPLYDGVSVVGFSCHVGDRLIVGEVKEKEKAKEVYNDAIARGETAGLLEQLPEASDVFTTTVGNIPPDAKVVVNITYLGELKHGMEVDGIRFTIPTSILPRYGTGPSVQSDSIRHMDGAISITVDAEMAEGSFIQKLQSPSHPISMSLGTTSTDPNATPSMSRASATLTLGVAHLDTDFVLQVVAKDTGTPKAVLEMHPTIPNHRALMATLVPKFTLPPEKPEIVFICDQSGSMGGANITLAKQALQVFLKSLPLGVKFNICSFGSRYSFLFPRSESYSKDSLAQAISLAQRLDADYGGTEMLHPIAATIENRYKDMPLDIILLTDGEIWEQQQLFDYLNTQIQETKAPIRVFTLGIGSGVSHALIEGVAKAGNGFSQTVQHGEQMNSKVVRMLKGALSPHVNDYTLEVKYAATEEDDSFEIIEKVADSLKVKLDLNEKSDVADSNKKTISLFDPAADLDQTAHSTAATAEDRYAHLPPIPAPKIIQAPQSIPSLFAFNRTTVYLLLGPDAPRATPTSVILRGTSAHGPLELEIPVQVLDTPGETIHQLAAKKAVSELEQGRGWLASATSTDGELLKKRFDGRFSEIVEREAVRLGVQFQVGGKWCSFVATEKTSATKKTSATVEDDSKHLEEDWEFLEDEQPEGHEPMPHPASTAPKKELLWARQEPQMQQQQQQQMLRQVPTKPMFTLASMQASPAMSSPSASFTAFGAVPSSSATFRAFGSSNSNANRQSAAMSQAFAAPSASGLFGGAAPRARSSPLFDTAPAALSPALFGAAPAAPSSSGNQLQEYQLSLMLCEQQNRKRLFMARQEAPDSRKRQQPTQLSPPDAGLAQQSADDATGAEDEEYVPQPPPQPAASPSTSAHWCTLSPPPPSSTPPTGSPAYILASPSYSASSPGATPSPPAPDGVTSPTAVLASVSHSPQEVMHLLIAHQSFVGTFPYSSALRSWLGISNVDFAKAVRTLFGDDEGAVEEKRDLLATALGIVFLEKKVGECKDEWELVVEKARAWLESAVQEKGREVSEVLAAAEMLVTS